MALYGDVFINTLRNFRLCWLAGRVGGGKTALAVRLGYYFYERGWAKHIIGNFPCVLFTDLHRLPELRDCFVILDEAGVWMDERLFDQVVAYLRKRNVYVMMPSYLAPPTKARSIYVQRTLNGHAFGVNCWWYTGMVKNLFVQDKYSLAWTNPREVYGLWDTSHVASDDGGIIDLFIDTFGELQRGKTRANRQAPSALPDGGGGVDVEALRGVADSLWEQTAELTGALSVASKSVRGGKRRR